MAIIVDAYVYIFLFLTRNGYFYGVTLFVFHDVDGGYGRTVFGYPLVAEEVIEDRRQPTLCLLLVGVMLFSS